MVHFEPSRGKAGAGSAADRESLAPVTYLPGASPAEQADDAADDAAEEREHAEKLLLRRLRGRSLSIVEAQKLLRSTEIDEVAVQEILERFTELHYLDEEKLADQIMHSHHERKGLGRSGVGAEMRQRGLDAELIAEKLEEMPDDEAERATELALKRVQQLDRFDDATIDRRLTGFLMRKGYASSVVRDAVKAALASRRGSGRASTVRFR
ncbi:RecX family transcriptional regulator [Cryobacterium adonitolivorans]|uniref:Regulatory protein RecX n=1 Tax=Cryobacterium adonitolivorans TaxID=1259189 RepID=A0A4R8W2F6_9MICO|nr:regulatory protein RecX [Cryobacterium adonitolivorans]TFC00431.1 RecX family transcriptional regulator [Cryobacterium adonitolivorans]